MHFSGLEDVRIFFLKWELLVLRLGHAPQLPDRNSSCRGGSYLISFQFFGLHFKC